MQPRSARPTVAVMAVVTNGQLVETGSRFSLTDIAMDTSTAKMEVMRIAAMIRFSQVAVLKTSLF